MESPNMDQEGRLWKWAIEPHPYDSDFDVMVTDDDKEALAAIRYAGEMHLWDTNDGGDTRTLRVTHRPGAVAPNPNFQAGGTL